MPYPVKNLTRPCLVAWGRSFSGGGDQVGGSHLLTKNASSNILKLLFVYFDRLETSQARPFLGGV